MRRAPAVISATVAGLAGVLAFHTHNSSGLGALGTTRTSGSKVAGNGAAASGRTTPKPATHRSTTGHTPATTGATTPTTANPTPTGTVTGSLVQYGYGQLAVKVTEHDGKITGLSLASLATAESYSQQLAQQAVPQLAQEVLSAQSANIQAISGATYTSQAYANSVQSAIDKFRKL